MFAGQVGQVELWEFGFVDVDQRPALFDDFTALGLLCGGQGRLGEVAFNDRCADGLGGFVDDFLVVCLFAGFFKCATGCAKAKSAECADSASHGSEAEQSNPADWAKYEERSGNQCACDCADGRSFRHSGFRLFFHGFSYRMHRNTSLKCAIGFIDHGGGGGRDVAADQADVVVAYALSVQVGEQGIKVGLVGYSNNSHRVFLPFQLG